MKKINLLYFSPTGTTKKIVKTIGEYVAFNLNDKSLILENDFTLIKNRKKSLFFVEDDIVILGVPVYAGRVPNIILNFLNSIESSGAKIILIVLYGNRDFDDALIELKDISIKNKFKIVAGLTFIGEHSFSKILAKNRPDEKDIDKAKSFAYKISEKLNLGNFNEEVYVKGNRPYREYYRPKNEKGNFVDIRKVKPKTKNTCIDCKICIQKCPMNSINFNNVEKIQGICIKCGACIKECPKNAKYFDDINYLRHKKELEMELVERKEPEIFI